MIHSMRRTNIRTYGVLHAKGGRKRNSDKVKNRVKEGIKISEKTPFRFVATRDSAMILDKGEIVPPVRRLVRYDN